MTTWHDAVPHFHNIGCKELQVIVPEGNSKKTNLILSKYCFPTLTLFFFLRIFKIFRIFLGYLRYLSLILTMSKAPHVSYVSVRLHLNLVSWQLTLTARIFKLSKLYNHVSLRLWTSQVVCGVACIYPNLGCCRLAANRFIITRWVFWGWDQFLLRNKNVS